MYVKVDIDNYFALKDMCWCNEENFNKIERYGLEDEFFDYIEEIFSDGIYADITINDAIRFDENIEAFIGEHYSFDNVDSLENLLEIASDLYYDAEDTIKEIIENGQGEKLWNILQEQFTHEFLQEVFEFIESDLDWVRETKTLDDIDSLEELGEYAEDEEKEVIDDATEHNYDNYLWEYIQDNYAGENLSDVLDEISSLEPNDYIYFDNINSLTEFINFTKDNDTVMEVIDAVKKTNLTDEYWNRLEEECKGVGMTLTNVIDDIESSDVDELIESL